MGNRRILNAVDAEKEMKKLVHLFDNEKAHILADDILCDLLCTLGYRDLIEQYDKLERYFA